MADLSDLRMFAKKMPKIEVSTPIAGITSGNTKPNDPSAAEPKINAATKVTA
jgi:hypothetical protein